MWGSSIERTVYIEGDGPSSIKRGKTNLLRREKQPGKDT